MRLVRGGPPSPSSVVGLTDLMMTRISPVDEDDWELEFRTGGMGAVAAGEHCDLALTPFTVHWGNGDEIDDGYSEPYSYVGSGDAEDASEPCSKIRPDLHSHEKFPFLFRFYILILQRKGGGGSWFLIRLHSWSLTDERILYAKFFRGLSTII